MEKFITSIDEFLSYNTRENGNTFIAGSYALAIETKFKDFRPKDVDIFMINSNLTYNEFISTYVDFFESGVIIDRILPKANKDYTSSWNSTRMRGRMCLYDNYFNVDFICVHDEYDSPSDFVKNKFDLAASMVIYDVNGLTRVEPINNGVINWMPGTCWRVLKYRDEYNIFFTRKDIKNINVYM